MLLFSELFFLHDNSSPVRHDDRGSCVDDRYFHVDFHIVADRFIDDGCEITDGCFAQTIVRCIRMVAIDADCQVVVITEVGCIERAGQTTVFISQLRTIVFQFAGRTVEKIECFSIFDGEVMLFWIGYLFQSSYSDIDLEYGFEKIDVETE